MNDLNKPKGNGIIEKSRSRRPMWRSLKVVTHVDAPVDSSNLRKTMDPPSPSANNTTSGQVDDDFITANTTAAAPKPASINSADYKKTRLSSWLSQQVHEHQANTHCSPSWVDDRKVATMSNLSLVSHASSINENDTANGRKRSSSLPNSPTTSKPRLLSQPVISNNSSTTPPLSPQPILAQQQPVITTPVAMICPSSSTSTVSDHTPLITPAIMDDHSFTHSFGILPLSANTTSILNLEQNDDDDDHNREDSDDDDNDTYTTASGTNSYMNHRRDEIDDKSSIHAYNSNDRNSSSINETNAAPSIDSDNGSGNQLKGIRYRHRTSSMQALYVNSVVDAMDPEVAQILLEWRRQSLLSIDWFDLFSVKSEIWCSSTLFHLQPNQLPHSPYSFHQSSSHSSIATSLISLDYKGIPLDKAFRSYSDKIDYLKASVLDIDQALKVFAQLYWECNPSPRFRCAELVYIVVHSLMLLLTGIRTGRERITADDFCNRTMALILDHQTSIPLLPFDMDDENTWQQSMAEYLQSLYKSFSRSSLFSTGRPHLPDSMVFYQRHHHQQKRAHHPYQETKFSNQLEAAFDNMFIDTVAPQNNTAAVAPTQRASAPQKKHKRNQHRRSKSLSSTPSWTLVRRRDINRAKIGPSKEGPLQCQLNGEEWKICWVILHHCHLYLYHHLKDGEATHPTLHHPLTSSPLHLEASSRNKFKQKFMHHLISSSVSNTTTTTATSNNMSPATSHGQLKKKEPYQVVDIYLGNAFCEKIHSHAFSLQLVNGNSYAFDCGSEIHAASWVQACNYWSARETKIVLSRGLLAHPPPSSSSPSSAIIINDSSLLSWKRPPPPAGASVLGKKGQQEAIDIHLLYLQTELKTLLQHEPGPTTLPAWQDMKIYLELEIRKYQCYHDSIYS